MIHVFVIDDSMVVRNAIHKLLEQHEEIKVIGEAPNPVDAMEQFRQVGFPDVFILDIEMPKMDGLSFLKLIKEQNPTPVIICSTMVSAGSTAAIDALRYGAVEVVKKPLTGVREFFREQKEEFIFAIKAAARSKVVFKPKVIQKPLHTPPASFVEHPSKTFVAIGSSTGGVQVIEEIVSALKPDHKGVVITQHMPGGFTASFAARLNNLAVSKVVEAQDGEIISDGKVILAKGGVHMEVGFKEGHYYVYNRDFPKVNYHKPSVNVLFKSIAKVCSGNVSAFILTGMGDDGAMGMLGLQQKGCLTYSQEESSCAVYGMPGSAKKLGAVARELSIPGIIETINAL